MESEYAGGASKQQAAAGDDILQILTHESASNILMLTSNI